MKANVLKMVLQKKGKNLKEKEQNNKKEKEQKFKRKESLRYIDMKACNFEGNERKDLEFNKRHKSKPMEKNFINPIYLKNNRLGDTTKISTEKFRRRYNLNFESERSTKHWIEDEPKDNPLKIELKKVDEEVISYLSDRSQKGLSKRKLDSFEMKKKHEEIKEESSRSYTPTTSSWGKSSASLSKETMKLENLSEISKNQESEIFVESPSFKKIEKGFKRKILPKVKSVNQIIEKCDILLQENIEVLYQNAKRFQAISNKLIKQEFNVIQSLHKEHFD